MKLFRENRVVFGEIEGTSDGVFVPDVDRVSGVPSPEDTLEVSAEAVAKETNTDLDDFQVKLDANPEKKHALYEKMASYFVELRPFDPADLDDLKVSMKKELFKKMVAEEGAFDSLLTFATVAKKKELIVENFVNAVGDKLAGDLPALTEEEAKMVSDGKKVEGYVFGLIYSRDADLVVNKKAILRDPKESAKEAADKAQKKAEKALAEDEAVDELMTSKKAKIVIFILSFLGILDGDDLKRDRAGTLRGLVNGDNETGHFICGLLGMDFAKDSVDGLVESLRVMSPELADKANELRKQAADKYASFGEKADGAMTITSFSGLILGATKDQAKALPEDVAVDVEKGLMVPAGKDLYIDLPIGGALKLLGSNGKALSLTDDKGVAVDVAADGTVSSSAAKVVKVAAGEVIGKGSSFGKGTSSYMVEKKKAEEKATGAVE